MEYGSGDSSLADDVARRFVGTDAEQSRMAQLAVRGPFDERDLHDQLGPHPVRAFARQPDPSGERRRRDLEPIELDPKVQQLAGIEARADLAGKDQVVSLEHANQQRAEADAGASRIREAADDEFL